LTLTYGRIVLARLTGRRRVIAPLFGAFLLATTLLVMLPETSFLLAGASFQSFLASLPAGSSTVQIASTGLGSDEDVSVFRQDLAARAATDGHGLMREVGFRVGFGFLHLSKLNGQSVTPEDSAVLALMSHSDLLSQAHLIAGNWSIQATGTDVSSTLPEQTAHLINAKPGDRLCLAGESAVGTTCVLVAGIWRATDPRSAYWSGDVSLPIGVEVARSELTKLASQHSVRLEATAVLAPDIPVIARSDLNAAQDALEHIGPTLTSNLPNLQAVTVLDTEVADFSERSRVAAFALQLITAQLWLVGLYSLIFLIRVRLEQDRESIVVWRTRGWPPRLVAALVSAEIAAVAALALIPAVGIGFGLAVAVTQAAYPAFHLPLAQSVVAVAPVVVGGVLVMAASVVVLARLSARAPILRARSDDAGAKALGWSAPITAGIACAIALPLIAEAWALGDARVRGAGATLPYDLLLPGLGLGLIAFAGSTLMAPAARTIARRAWGLTTKLAAIGLARGSGMQRDMTLVLSAAIGLAVLAAAYSGTAAGNVSDRTAYAAGADLRVIAGGSRPVDLERIPIGGATARTEVLRGYTRVGSPGKDVPSLGVDPYSFAKVAWTRPGLLDPDLNTEMHRLANAEVGGTLLPEGTTGLSIWVRGERTGGSLTASFTDADMLPVTAAFGSLEFDGWRNLSASFAPIHFRSPLRLRRLTITPVIAEGTIALSDFSATGAAQSPDLIYGFDATYPLGPGWWISDGSTGLFFQNLEPDTRYPRDQQKTAHIRVRPGLLPITVNPPVVVVSHQVVQIPVLVSRGLLDRNRAKIGGVIAVLPGDPPVEGLVVGSFEYFPTLYADSVVYSLPLLLQVLAAHRDSQPWPTELWASVPIDKAQADVKSLSADPALVDVISRYDLERQKAADPLAVAARTNLVLGFSAACILAVVAFAIYFAFVARSRISEHAILLAIGLSASQLRRVIWLQQLMILAYSTLLGIIVGGLLAAVLLPGLQVSTSIADITPPTVLGIDPGLGIAGIVSTIGACILAGALVSRPPVSAEVMIGWRSLA